MTDDTNEGVGPAPYPESDTSEHEAIDILDYIFDSSVKSYIDSRDKAPNHDGFIELVNKDLEPIGRIVVQVKKLPNKNSDDPKRQFETKHLAYCKSCIEPFMLLVVDVENEVAYWREITEEWFNEENL
jgi:hypothetical protein